MYKHNRKLAAVLAGTLLMLVALTGCQSKKGNVQGGTSTAQRTSMSSAASSSTTTVPQFPSAPAETTLPATGAATAAPCVQA